MKPVSLRRAWLEVSVIGAIWWCVLALQNYPLGVVVLITVCSLIFAIRLRPSQGRWWRQIRRELLALCVLLLMLCLANWVSWSVYGSDESAWSILIEFAEGIIPFTTWRMGFRIWRYWNRLRKRRLMWTLAHAHLLVVFGGMLSFMFLAIAFLFAVSPPRNLPGQPDVFLRLLQSLVVMAPFLVVMFAIMIAVALPFFAIFSYFVVRPTVRRVQALVTTTNKIGGGDYAARISIRGEDEVAQLQANFNQMADTLENSMQELRDERDVVTKLLQAQRELMTSVSHELRTPVATLRGYVESMQRAMPESAQRDLQIVDKEITHLQTLIEDLFTLARAEVGQLTLRCEPADMIAIVRQIVAVTTPTAWNVFRVQLVAEMPEHVPPVRADTQRIEQILRNLLQNSLRHTPPGGIVTVEVAAERETVRLAVEDTGEGIAPDDLAHIWERFYRGSGNHSADGIGLGLALVKELAEAMHGSVQAHSAAGEGSRFTIYLPKA
jgi:signal transduction histidine kinase